MRHKLAAIDPATRAPITLSDSVMSTL